MDVTEMDRCDRLIDAMPNQKHLFPLVEHHISKHEAHRILEASGVDRPQMYDLGYNNNNCVGCVKGGMGYWNKIRIDFPKVFQSRAQVERLIGATCIKGIYLDELDPMAGRHTDLIIDDCGIFCESMILK
jgi:hypothetical protein